MRKIVSSKHRKFISLKQFGYQIFTLGAKCKGIRIIKFSINYQFQKLYLVGDIIDCWRLRKDGIGPGT